MSKTNVLTYIGRVDAAELKLVGDPASNIFWVRTPLPSWPPTPSMSLCLFLLLFLEEKQLRRPMRLGMLMMLLISYCCHRRRSPFEPFLYLPPTSMKKPQNSLECCLLFVVGTHYLAFYVPKLPKLGSRVKFVCVYLHNYFKYYILRLWSAKITPKWGLQLGLHKRRLPKHAAE